MLNSIATIQNLEPESFHVARHESVVANAIHSQAFLFGDFNMGRFRRKLFSKLCSFCGEEARYYFKKSGNYCCESNVAKCLAIRKINSEKARQRTGWEHTEKTKEKIRQSNLGQKRSEKTRKKISKAKIAMGDNHPSKRPEFRKAISRWLTKRNIENNPMKNPEAVKKMIEKIKGKNHPFYGIKRPKHSKNMLGKNNPNWQGGIAAELYCSVWNDKEYKESISKRDNYICRNPNCLGTCSHLPLVRHHINYDKKNCHPWNLIILCVSCHSKTNGSREFWIKFYQNIMTEKHGYDYD